MIFNSRKKYVNAGIGAGILAALFVAQDAYAQLVSIPGLDPNASFFGLTLAGTLEAILIFVVNIAILRGIGEMNEASAGGFTDLGGGLISAAKRVGRGVVSGIAKGRRSIGSIARAVGTARDIGLAASTAGVGVVGKELMKGGVRRFFGLPSGQRVTGTGAALRAARKPEDAFDRALKEAENKEYRAYIQKYPIERTDYENLTDKERKFEYRRLQDDRLRERQQQQAQGRAQPQPAGGPRVVPTGAGATTAEDFAAQPPPQLVTPVSEIGSGARSEEEQRQRMADLQASGRAVLDNTPSSGGRQFAEDMQLAQLRLENEKKRREYWVKHVQKNPGFYGQEEVDGANQNIFDIEQEIKVLKRRAAGKPEEGETREEKEAHREYKSRYSTMSPEEVQRRKKELENVKVSGGEIRISQPSSTPTAAAIPKVEIPKGTPLPPSAPVAAARVPESEAAAPQPHVEIPPPAQIPELSKETRAQIEQKPFVPPQSGSLAGKLYTAIETAFQQNQNNLKYGWIGIAPEVLGIAHERNNRVIAIRDKFKKLHQEGKLTPQAMESLRNDLGKAMNYGADKLKIEPLSEPPAAAAVAVGGEPRRKPPPQTAAVETFNVRPLVPSEGKPLSAEEVVREAKLMSSGEMRRFVEKRQRARDLSGAIRKKLVTTKPEDFRLGEWLNKINAELTHEEIFQEERTMDALLDRLTEIAEERRN